MVASFYIRFGEEGLAARWWLLVIVLPAFVVYSALVYGWSDLYKAKFTDRVHFIRLGSGGNQQSDDLFVTVVVYATINSNLVLTVDRIDYFVDCK